MLRATSRHTLHPTTRCRKSSILLLTLLLALSGCDPIASTSTDAPPDPHEAVSLGVLSPEGTVGEPLAEPLALVVLGSDGRPLSGVEVGFHPASGGGTVRPSAMASDADGIVRTRWTLGPEAGEQELEIRLEAREEPLGAVTAHARPGAPHELVVRPEAVELRPGSGIDLEALVLDVFGNPIAPVAARWTVSDESVAQVDGNGRLLALAEGSTEVEAVPTDPEGGEAVFVNSLAGSRTLRGSPDAPDRDRPGARIDVREPDEEDGDDVGTLTIDPQHLRLTRIGAEAQLDVQAHTASGEVLADASVEWSSSDTSIAEVTSEGTVIATGAGIAWVVVTASCCVPDTATVEVDPEPEASTAIHPGDDIQATVDAHPAGTVFSIQPGIHRMQEIRPRDGQQFIGEPGAVLSGAGLLTSWTSDGGHWVSTAQPVQSPSSRSCMSGYPRCTWQENLFIDDEWVLHVDRLSDLGPGRWHFDRDRERVYVYDDPRGRTVEIAQVRHAFSGNARDVVIRGLVIEKYANRHQSGAIHGAEGSGWTVEANVVRMNHGVGIRTGHTMTVRDNEILLQGQLGIGGRGDDVLVEGNRVAYNNQAGYRPGWEAGGSKFVRTVNLVVRGNHFHDNRGKGIWTDIDNIDSLIEHNLVEDEWQAGIFHEISYDAVIRYNTVRRVGWQRASSWLSGGSIQVAGSPNVEIYGNVVEGGWHGITAIQQDRGSGRHGPYILRNLRVYDNTIRMPRGVTGVARDDGDDEVFSEAGGNRFWGNTYYVDDADDRRWEWDGGRRDWDRWRSYGHDPDGELRLSR